MSEARWPKVTSAGADYLERTLEMANALLFHMRPPEVKPNNVFRLTMEQTDAATAQGQPVATPASIEVVSHLAAKVTTQLGSEEATDVWRRARKIARSNLSN